MDRLAHKKILVTGADGFIGSHLTEGLVRSGHKVKAFCYYNSFGRLGWLDTLPADIMDQVEVFLGDIRDPHGVEEATKDCDVVFHLAALIAIPYSYHSPDTYIDTNIKGTLNVLQAAKRHNIKRMIHTSTSETYGTAQFVPMTEEHPLVGQSPYSASKIGADQLAISFYRSFQTPVTVLRPFNTYGPRQSTRAVIPTIITQIASGTHTIQLGALTPTRDFTFVKDTVRGFFLAAQSDAALGEVIHIGSQFEVSIGETARLIAECFDRDITIQEDPQRHRPEKSEVNRLFADTTKAEKLLNWAPEHGGSPENFKKGLKKTIEWFTDPQNLSQYKVNTYQI